MEWKDRIIDKADEKIKTLSNKTSSKFRKSVLHQSKSLNTLNNIQNQFIVNAICKANRNFIFLCH